VWQFKGKDAHGRHRDVAFTEVDFTHRSTIQETFHKVMGAKTFKLFEAEIEQPDALLGIDGIESWGAKAAGLINSTVFNVGYGPVATTDQGANVSGITATAPYGAMSLAFHSPEVLVADVSGIQELEISAEHSITVPPSARFPLSGSVLESRIYSESSVIEAESETGPEAPTFRIPVPAKHGGLIARVAHWMARPFQYTRDPTSHGRLRHYENKYSVIAKHYPDISLAAAFAGEFRAIHKAPAGGAVMVFVHGTYSCAIPHLALLHPLIVPTYRFEHDTFSPIDENRSGLVTAVKEFIPKGTRLYLVAHSRGGLVSRLAARELVDDYDVRVMTYGTPHKGTPLANAGKRLFTALLAGGRSAVLVGAGTAASAVFSWDPASLAGKLLLKGILPSGFPPGLDIMRPQSGLVAGLSGVKEPFSLRTWAAECEVDNLPAGAAAFAHGELPFGIFGGAANDTVVAVDSAIGAGTPQKVLNECTHSQYFAHPDVYREIRLLR
jgi:hypothetical protein